MGRYIVTICDVNDHEIDTQVIRASGYEAAVLSHPWIKEVYLPKYIQMNLEGADFDGTLQNLKELLGYVASCENLDELIMNDLNGGDSNVSSMELQHHQV